MPQNPPPQTAPSTALRSWLAARPEFKTPPSKFTRRCLAAAVACCLLSALACLLINETHLSESIQHLDGWRRTVKQGMGWSSKVFLLLTALAWIRLRFTWRVLLAALLAVGLTSVAVFAIKVSIDRPRPSYSLKGNEDKGSEHSSFPSGDAAMAFAAAAAFAAFVAPPWQIALYTLAAAVSINRVIALGHYPSDIAAGAAVGFLCALLAIRLLSRLLRPPPHPSAPIPAG